MAASIQQQVLEALQTLSPDNQQKVLTFAVNLRNQQQRPSESSQSFLDVAKEFIGRAEGPGDLSTNSDYMQGYGTKCDGR